MGRYTTNDFGYDFPLKQEETTSLVASIPKSEEHTNNTPAMTQSGSSEGGPGYELYEDHQQQRQQQEQQQGKEPYRYQPAKFNRGGENFFVASDDAAGGGAVNPIECIGAFCCCITISFVVIGGILLAYVKYQGTDPMQLLGSVLLVIAAGTFLFGCCALCIGSAADGLLDSNNSGQSKGDPNFKEVQVRFRRLNDRYEKGCMKAEDGLQHVRLDVVGHMKEVCIINSENCSDIFNTPFILLRHLSFPFPSSLIVHNIFFFVVQG